jgi:hypothetical protein
MAYITTEETKEIRKALKENFPEWKFSVRREHHSSVRVTILEGPKDFSDILHEHRAMTINHYWLNKYGKHEPFFQKIIDIIKTAPAKATNGRAWYDRSDAMTDYFDIAFYIHLELGRWEKPYKIRR